MARCNVLVAVVVLAVAGLQQQQRCEAGLVTLVLANGRKASVPLSVSQGRRRLRAAGDCTCNGSGSVPTASITVTGTDTSHYNADLVIFLVTTT